MLDLLDPAPLEHAPVLGLEALQGLGLERLLLALVLDAVSTGYKKN